MAASVNHSDQHAADTQRCCGLGFRRHADTKRQVECSDELRQQLWQQDSDLTQHAALGKGRHCQFETFLPVHGNDAHGFENATASVAGMDPGGRKNQASTTATACGVNF
jgi:hypothetical protein